MKACQCCLIAILLTSGPAAVLAGTVYVNNQIGDDRFDGRSPTRTAGESGPVLTLRRAMLVARHGDTVVLAPGDKPYHGSLNLTGWRHSGNETVPFRVQGNGATISGAQPVPATAWRQHEGFLWSFEPQEKGHYVLLRDDRPVPRFQTSIDQALPSGVPVGHFAVCRGRVFYQADKQEDPAAENFAVAGGTTGISLYGVRHVVIENLNVQHFRVDGLNAHDLCREVLVAQVTSTGNGRSGLTVAGSSNAVFRDCVVRENAEFSVLIDEFGQADLRDCQLDADATVKPRTP